MTKLVEVLLRISTPSDASPPETIVLFGPTFNDSQRQAVEFTMESPEVACIHGPPIS